MPRLPVDGKKVIEYRISLGQVERDALKSLVTSTRINSITGDNGVLDEFSSVGDVTKKLAVIGFFLELFGITDFFNFDDDARVEAYTILSKLEERAQEKGVTFAAAQGTIDILSEILTLGKFDTETFNA